MDLIHLFAQLDQFWQQAKARERNKGLTLSGRVLKWTDREVWVWTEEKAKLLPLGQEAFGVGDYLLLSGKGSGVVSQVHPREGVLEILLEPSATPRLFAEGEELSLRRQNLFLLYERKEELWHQLLESPFPLVEKFFALLRGERLGLSPLERTPLPQELADKLPLDSSQQAALEAMLATPDFWCLWGPPGTGKSTLAALAIHHFLAQGQRVFLTSLQHGALDTVLSRLLQLFPEEEGRVVRLGPVGKTRTELHPFLLPYRMERQKWTCVEECLEAHPLVVGTLSSCASEVLWDRTFDVVILDEAARPPIPLALLALMKAEKRCFLLGDPLQLRPILPEGVTGLLENSLLEVAMSHEEVRQFRLSQLTKNYRASKGLVVVSERIYESHGHEGLVSGRLAASLPPSPSPLLCGERPVVYIPKEEPDARWYKFGPERSLVSPWELACVYDLARLFEPVVGYPSLWLLSPFRLQSFLLSQLFRRKHVERQLVSTVDQAQGGERKVVIFSLVADRARTVEKKIPLERLNVAFSRAQAKFVFVGRIEVLLEVDLVAPFVEGLLDHGHEVSFSPSSKTLERVEKKVHSFRKLTSPRRQKLGESFLQELARIPREERSLLGWIPRISQRKW